MKDNEIIKALPTIAYGGHSCDRCKHKITKGEDRCGVKGCKIARNALDLINRQKAEIETINVYCENLEISQNHLLNELATARKKAKSEAIRDVAAKLPDLIPNINGETTMEAVEMAIKHLVKEMVGDE